MRFFFIIISARLTFSPDFQGPPSEDLFKRRASYQDVRNSLLKKNSVDFLGAKSSVKLNHVGKMQATKIQFGIG